MERRRLRIRRITHGEAARREAKVDPELTLTQQGHPVQAVSSRRTVQILSFLFADNPEVIASQCQRNPKLHFCG
jgi:hypothetical protein